MKEYLLLFRNASGNDGYLATSEDMAAAMPAWQAWIGQIAMQGKLVHTAPIEYSGRQVTNFTDVEGPYKEVNSIVVTGYLICKSTDESEVVRWAKECPVLQYPDSSVEIRSVIPFPVL